MNVSNLCVVSFPNLKVTPYLFAKINYGSVIDWYWKADIARTNPNFHNRPRYDFALLQIDANQCVFIQLLFLFSTEYNGIKYQLALALPLDLPPLERNAQRDRELRLCRVRPRRRQASIIVNMEMIVRGALLTEDLSSEGGEKLVVEFIDEDFWLRLKSVDLMTRVTMH